MNCCLLTEPVPSSSASWNARRSRATCFSRCAAFDRVTLVRNESLPPIHCSSCGSRTMIVRFVPLFPP